MTFRDFFFAFLALVFALAAVAWLGDGPRLGVETIEANVSD